MEIPSIGTCDIKNLKVKVLIGLKIIKVYKSATQFIQQLIEQTLHHNKESTILNIGCGNGQIQDRLYELGYQYIINNDISSIVIEEMIQVKNKKGYQNMVYQVMDVRNMKYQNEQFDMILDKSTIDALLCSSTPIVSVAMMLKEVYRTLKIDGLYFMISYGRPTSRMEHLLRQHVCFNIQIIELVRQCEDNREKLTHYIYICKKKLTKSKFNEQDYKKTFQKLKKMEEQEFN